MVILDFVICTSHRFTDALTRLRRHNAVAARAVWMSRSKGSVSNELVWGLPYFALTAEDHSDITGVSDFWTDGFTPLGETMARYVMANRRAGKYSQESKTQSLDTLNHYFDSQLAGAVDLLGDYEPRSKTDRRVLIFEADPTEILTKRQVLPSDVIVEPEIRHFPMTAVPLDLQTLDLLPTGQGSFLRVGVTGMGRPLEGTSIMLVLRGPGNRRTLVQAVTDSAGKAEFTFGTFWSAAAILVYPAGGFWSLIIRGPREHLDIELTPLPEGPTAWWHSELGAGDLTAGMGVKIGVADTGVGPHPAVAQVQSIGAFEESTHLDTPRAGLDVDSHGTHVCGIISARPMGPSDFRGIAPGATVFGARVFPSKDSSANQADISNAIDYFSKDLQVDLINLSLGSLDASQVLHDAILDATERGTLCVCAAGNHCGEVSYPAAFPETIAVAAIGQAGWGPPGSLASTHCPTDPGKHGANNLFLAGFSCFGDSIGCCAPGVGVISTVPERYGLSSPYSALDGTSMASPCACATLAAALAKMPDYMALPRDVTRYEAARAVLSQRCREIGLAAKYQGKGLPLL